MTTRILAALALAGVLCAGATSAAADDPKLPDVKAFDKLVIDALRDAHNKGADLYNTSKDFVGAYRLYQGAAGMAVKPLLGHRPDAQKIIDTGLADAEKESDAARRAFLLHEAIENVRKNLKTGISAPKPEEVKKPEPPKKPDEPKKAEEVKKPEPPKVNPLPVAPVPHEKGGKPPAE